MPDKQFQEVAADFCSNGGQSYLIPVDCFTDWPNIIPMDHNTTAVHLVNVLSIAERNNRIFGLFVRNGDIRMFSSQ